MQLPFQVMQSKVINGTKDRTKQYTIVEGIATLLDGTQAFCEAFLNGQQHFAPGHYAMELALQVNRQSRRIEAQVKAILPLKSAAPAAATAPAARAA